MKANEAIEIVKSKMRGRTYYGGKEPHIDEVLVEEIERLRAELAKANEIIERLPKTADGVRVVPGAELLWWVTRAGDVAYGDVDTDVEIVVRQGRQDIRTVYKPISECYSTREAAEQAMKETSDE